MKSSYISPEKLNDVILRMKYENGLAIRLCNATGLRLSDVLHITYDQVRRGNRITVKEQKTGKSRRVYVPTGLHREMIDNAKHYWVFPHRTKTDRPRTRQTVYIDFKRACKRSGIDPAGMSPHSVRKLWAVRAYSKSHSIIDVQKKLLHRDTGTTALYAFSDKME